MLRGELEQSFGMCSKGTCWRFVATFPAVPQSLQRGVGTCTEALMKQKLQGASTAPFSGSSSCFVSALTAALIPGWISRIGFWGTESSFLSLPLPSSPAAE